DSCDPEAVKEELAKAEPVPTSDEEGMEEEKDDKHKEQEKTDTVKEELTKAEPVPVSDKEVTGEGKDDEHEEQEEPDTVKEEQAD
ncbi:MAG: hypothetical protein OET87_03540, partial [Desulfobulbaceae bacterium]|nr:hypothetical protein [Desulfobulbaceae bacterium]